MTESMPETEKVRLWDQKVQPVELTTRSTTRSAAMEERVVAFTLDGREYTIPARHKPAIGLRYLFETKTLGAAQAEANMMESVLGEDGFRALAYHEDLTPEQNEAIQALVQFYVMGGPEKSGKAR